MPKINHDDYSVFAQILADSSVKKILEKADEPDIPHEFSSDFEKKMNKLVAKERKFYFPMIRTTARKALMISVIMVVMLSVMCMSVSALRNTVINFVGKVFDNHIEEAVTDEIPAETAYKPTITVPHTTTAETTVTLTVTTTLTKTKTQTETTAVKITAVNTSTENITAVTTVKTTTKKVITKAAYSESDNSICFSTEADGYTYPYVGGYGGNYGDYFKSDIISEDRLKDKIADRIWTMSGLRREYRNAEVYSIKNTPVDYRVAVRCEDEKEFVVYEREDYVPAHIDDIVMLYDLKNQMKVESISVMKYKQNHAIDDVSIYAVDEEFLWEHYLLRYNDDPPSVFYDMNYKPFCILDMETEVSGRQCFFVITENGYLVTDICGNDTLSFYIGIEHVEEIKKYVVENCQMLS